MVKPLEDDNSRFYFDYTNEGELVEGIFEMFEQQEKLPVRDKGRVLCSIADIIEFVEKLKEVTLLIYDSSSKVYLPHGKNWIKSFLIRKILRQ